jgi:RHH-type proline utilization regulon transcriptional repressor/proline dehydrogenase/delta 1-pyrroline-5-carboxylate dehydrogenase
MSLSAPTRADIYPLSKLALPQGWTLVLPTDYLSALDPQQMPAGLLDLLRFQQEKNFTHGFRREVSVDGFPMLAAVLPAEKHLLIGSRRLHRELALLAALELGGAPVAHLTEHVARISTLDPQRFPTEWEWVTWQQKLADWSDEAQWRRVEELTAEKLNQLVKNVQLYRPSLFEKVSDWGLGLTAQFALIRVHLLKFLALLPSLDHDKKGDEVKRNLAESLRRLQDDNARLRKGSKPGQVRPLPHAYASALRVALHVVQFVPAGLLALIVRGMVKKMAKRFIAGESIETSDGTLRSLHVSHREATLDQLGELVVSEAEADEYLKRVLTIVDGLKAHITPGERNGAGILKAHVSIKVSALASDFKPHAFDATFALVAPRLKRILLAAKAQQVFVNIDAEHYHYRDLVFRIYSRLLRETPELQGWGDTGIVLQAYLRDAAVHLRDIIELARHRGVRMPIRVVKGAYWDAETIEAEVHSHHAPQFLNKEESDLHFRQLAALALAHPAEVQLAVGSHNLQDHCFIEALRQSYYQDAPIIEHQCLHMTYEALSHGLAKMGWPTRNYMPIGNLLVGMAYLVRRIMENSSQVGVLTIMRSHNKRDAFVSPYKIHQAKRAQGELVRDDLETRLDSGFKNCTPARLYVEAEKDAFEKTLNATLTGLFAKQDAFREMKGQRIPSSSAPELVVGVVAETGPGELEGLLQEVTRGFAADNGWSRLPLASRVAVLSVAADLMWRRRNQLSALIVWEAGKAWTEALADVDEAVDFINFYCREAIRHQRTHGHDIPRGPMAVIAPWNFPLAIPCGMAVGPLVAGNPVILKPAEQTPLIARELVELLWEAGVPKAALQVVYGEGETVGAPLVRHPAVAGIIFTGSKNVGQWIYRTAAGQFYRHPWNETPYAKKVITEMGGKNAIIVTNNCEQDETVSGILYSAFAHAGQKCSACSRVLVDRGVKDALLARLVRAVEDLEAGPASDPSVMVNPLITAEDQARVRKAVQEARTEAELNGGKVWVDRSQENLAGFTVGPVVIELPLARAKRADSWAQREVFGPVVHVIPYEGLPEAVEVFNGTAYGLTGGIYGQSQDDIDELMKDLRCGNLYVNRPNTGARVAIEPFGGFKLSGTGPKAGGRDYLASFYVSPADKLSTEPVVWGQGSGYQYQTPKASLLSYTGRASRVQKLGQQLLTRYEVLFQRVGEAEKRQLQDLLNWFAAEGQAFSQGQHPNLRIPGQLSYDRKDAARESAALVATGKTPSLTMLFHLLSALQSGTGVALVCTSEAAWSTWKGIIELAWHAGLARQNLEIYQMSEENVRLMLRDPELSAVYVDGPLAAVEKIFQDALDPAALTIHMRALFHPGEHPSFDEPASWLNQYVWTRSFAVNTMRHGAPLEVGI